MSFQSYLDNIAAKTGKTPEDFRSWADDHGFADGGKLQASVKPMAVVNALKQEFGLGHGHAMAIVALLKGTKKEGDA